MEEQVLMIIHVCKDSQGKHWASRSFEGMSAEMPGNVFTLKQNKGESIPDFEERVRQEARQRNIKHVGHLDQHVTV